MTVTHRLVRDVGAALVLMGTLAFLLLHARWGLDLRDSTYAHALSARLSRGELPIRDEVNPHVLGAWPVAGPLAVWDRVHGPSGALLFGRSMYALMAITVGGLIVLLLRARWGSVPAALGVATTLLALPYAIGVASYNTTAMLAVTLAWAALFGSPGGGQRIARLVIAALSGAVCVLAHPAMGIAVGGLFLVAMVRGLRGGRPSFTAAMTAALGVGIGVVGVLAVLAGLAGRTATLDALSMTASQRSPWGSMASWWGRYLGHLAGSRILMAALVLGLAAAVAIRMRRNPGWLMAGAVSLVGAFTVRFGAANVAEPTAGSFAGAATMLIVVVLAVPIALDSLISPHADSWIAGATGVVLMGGSIGVVLVSMAHPRYGAIAVACGPALTMSIARLAQMAGSKARHQALAGVIAPLVLGLTLTAVVFNEGPASGLSETITDGPARGIKTGAANADADRTIRAMLDRCVERVPARVVIIGAPGAYAYLPHDVLPATRQLWNEGGDVTEAATLMAMADPPDCVIAPGDLGKGAGDVEAALQRRYEPVVRGSLNIRSPSGEDWLFTAWRLVIRGST